MSIITDLTRMWLTRSRKPFTLRREYDQTLSCIDRMWGLLRKEAFPEGMKL